MNRPEFDILVLSEPRFAGGTTTAILAEIEGAARAGLAVGFCPVMSPAFPRPAPLHPALAGTIAAGRAVLHAADEPSKARLVIVHHPLVFAALPARPVAVEAGQVMLVLQHPPLNGFGIPEYDLDAIVANMAEVFGREILIAPVGPAVRRQIRGVPPGGRMLDFDWHNLIDLDLWRFRQGARPGLAAGRIVIGRHSRPSTTKYPDTREEALMAYPEADDIAVRMLGFPPVLHDTYAPVPPNWELLEFGGDDVAAFLMTLDVFVYAHARRWVEAFGIAILEAMALGVPVVLPPSYQALFGPGAVYAAPAGMAAAARALAGDPAAYAKQARMGRAEAEARFGLDQALPRLRRVDPDIGQRPAMRTEARARRVLFVTSNGVGLGHLTRAMAVAARLPDDSATAIFTMSQAFRLATEAGYLTQFSPHHRTTGAKPEAWNLSLALELGDFMRAFSPDVVMFDGNVVYPGLLAAFDTVPSARRIWMRRALWPPEGKELPDTSGFDLVIEPAEISARFDRGATARMTDAHRVAPILASGPDARLSAPEARLALGLPPAGTVIALMLGAGTNYNLSGVRAGVLAALAGQPDIEVVEISPPILPETAAPAPDGPAARVRRIDLYPAYSHSRAFDAMIAGAGYNTFHENILGGIPTLFIPNEAGEMDLQILRARHAERSGAALMLRAFDLVGVREKVAALLDPAVRDRLRAGMARIAGGLAKGEGAQGDGAADAARIIGLLGHAIATARPL